MAVPEEIRAVPRPANTVVEDTKTNSTKRYAVRERSGTKYIPGKNPQPHNGRVIGHIIDNKFVPQVQAFFAFLLFFFAPKYYKICRFTSIFQLF